MSEKGKQTLVSLTQDFLDIIRRANGAEVELAAIAAQLGAQRRRLYDVTNVLAGIGVLERCGKSKVKWTAESSDGDDGALIQALAQEEAEIDKMSQHIEEALLLMGTSEEFKQFAWITGNDVAKLSDNGRISLFALKGPSDLAIEVPDDGPESDPRHRLVCHSQSGQIDFIRMSPGV